MRVPHALASILLLLLTIAGFAFSQPAPDKVLIGQARFIFIGTVQKTAASNLKLLPASEQTAIVRVDRVLRAPQTMDNFQGKPITVQLRTAGSVKVAAKEVYFTNPWLFGEHLAVREVARRPVSIESTLPQQIRDVEREQADTALLNRLRQAVLVVTGTVTATKPIERPREPVSEHNPLWWAAEVKVQSVEKGQSPGDVLTVFFPSSTDEAWYNSPKFKPGDTGIFLLQSRLLETYRLKGFSAVHPLDFQPVSARDQIRRLLEQLR